MQQWGGQEVDKTALKELVEAEKKVALEEKEYTKATWKEYKAALDEAEAIVKDDDATAAQVSAAMETLKSARAALVPANRKDQNRCKTLIAGRRDKRIRSCLSECPRHGKRSSEEQPVCSERD